jgi:hypothetical protein
MDDGITLQAGGLRFPASAHAVLAENLDFHFTTYYPKNRESLLSSLCDKYGSDKGEIAPGGHPYPWPSHTYADLIERIFGHCRKHVRAVFECGLGTNNPQLASSMGVRGKPGASLRVWRDYFPNAQIFGADIDKEILFQEERIKTAYCDQTDKAAIDALWREIGEIEFDLMIDDGLHTFEAGASLFEAAVHRLGDNGIYIIEDVAIQSLFRFAEYFSQTKYRYELVSLHRKGLPLNDNSLVIIRKG